MRKSYKITCIELSESLKRSRMNQKVFGLQRRRDVFPLFAHGTSLAAHFQCDAHFTSRTRSFSSTFNARAMFNRASTETVRWPFSKSEIKTTDKPAFSANVSWVILAPFRYLRMASPKTRRCLGIEGTTNENKPGEELTFTIV